MQPPFRERGLEFNFENITIAPSVVVNWGFVESLGCESASLEMFSLEPFLGNRIPYDTLLTKLVVEPICRSRKGEAREPQDLQ